MIDWTKIDRTDTDLIAQVVKRAKSLTQVPDPLALTMDISAAHLSCPLKLNALLLAGNFDFMHDVAGIDHHIDRRTGELTDCFLPRFAVRQGGVS